MADETAAPAKGQFICSFCKELKPVFYDWQRCYECMLVGVTRDYQATPTVCSGCCKREHHAKFSMK